MNKDREFQDLLSELSEVLNLQEKVISDERIQISMDIDVNKYRQTLRNMCGETNVEIALESDEIRKKEKLNHVFRLVEENKMTTLLGGKAIECSEKWCTLEIEERINLMGKVRKGFRKHGDDVVLFIKKKFYFISEGKKFKLVSYIVLLL